ISDRELWPSTASERLLRVREVPCFVRRGRANDLFHFFSRARERDATERGSVLRFSERFLNGGERVLHERIDVSRARREIRADALERHAQCLMDEVSFFTRVRCFARRENHASRENLREALKRTARETLERRDGKR